MKFCMNLGIKQQFMLVKHFKSNNQVELANSIILDELKKWLDKAKGKWVDKLPSILLLFRIASQIAMQEMPFKLIYGCETMTSIEIR